MNKEPISITLSADNLVWLRGRVGAAGLRSVSELLDQLVTAARQGKHGGPQRSVVGTVDIDLADPTLDRADAALRRLFEQSLARPLVVHEPTAAYTVRSRNKARRPDAGRAKKSRG
jgi:hypothetical protein